MIRRLSGNRVYIGIVLILAAVAVWEFGFRAWYRPLYLEGLKFYRAADYQRALADFAQAHRAAPKAEEVMVMLGWTHLKLHQAEQARQDFEAALRADPSDDEAAIGLATVIFETGRGAFDSSRLAQIARHREEPHLRLLLAAAKVQEGDNSEAFRIFRSLLHDNQEGASAEQAIRALLGLPPETAIPESLPQPQRTTQLQVPFRAAQHAMWRAGGSAWQPYYVVGVDLGPGAPGYFPGAPPQDAHLYAAWLQQASELNANVVRVYTLLPPSFYHAFAHQGSDLLLYQQIWVGDPPGKNFYDAAFIEQTRAEIRYVVDAIHGNGNVPHRQARNSGLYVHDIAARVGALLLGREVEPSTALETNRLNPGKTDYRGRYLSIAGGNATETWFAEMLDYLVAYESDTYNWQHPVAVVNWPPLDPLTHPTEAPLEDALRFRRARGEKLAPLTGVQDDSDVVAIDEANFRPGQDFRAGLFASYHVYPYWPDFLDNDPGYLKTRDSEGPNPTFGYLRELRARIPYPLIISEYGVPTSMGISHFEPTAWHHGGHTEAEQAAILRRLTRAIREAGCAGGIAFELLDEWYKHNWLTADLEAPLERANLWLNQMDPEKQYGLVGFHPSKARLFDGDPAAWAGESVLYQKGTTAKLQMAADEAFLYLRLDDICTDCLGAGGTAGPRAYVLALNTTGGRTGVRSLPFRATMQNGADFLLVIGRGGVRLLVADSYNPFAMHPKPDVPGENVFGHRQAAVSLTDTGAFRDIIVEPNPMRFARSGQVFPSRTFNWSTLSPVSAGNTLAEWSLNPNTRELRIRLAWGKLLFTDPSSHQVFGGFDSVGNVMTAVSPGVRVAVFALDRSELASAKVLDSMPVVQNQLVSDPALFTWPGWDAVQLQRYRKVGYYALQKEFLAQRSAALPAAAPDPNAAVTRPGQRGSAPGR